MAYMDPVDIRTITPEAEGLSDESLSIFIDEEEAYTATQLGKLPPSNPIVFGIIRDLVRAKAMQSLLPMQSDDYRFAEALRREAKDRLRVAKEQGLKPRVPPSVNVDAVANPFSSYPFFTLNDFGLSESNASLAEDPQL